MSEQAYRSKQKTRRSKPETKASEQERRSKPKRKRGKKVLFGAGVTLLVATVLAAVVLIQPKTNGVTEEPSASPTTSHFVSASLSPSATVAATEPAGADFQPPATAPLVYETGGRVLLASGKGRVSLGKSAELYGCYGTMNAMLSGDNRFFYYLTGLNMDTGKGTLMMVRADGKELPAAVAEGVCAANVSYDGKNVMYITDMNGAAGTLHASQGGAAERVAHNVLPVYFGFSDSGEYMTYIVQEGAEAFAMYVKKSGAAPELVTRMTASAIIDGGVNLTRLNAFMPLNNGQVLYSVEENYNMPLYLYTCQGGTERLCNDGYIVKAFATGGFLYAETGREAKPLWYKAPGKEPVPVSDNYDYIIFPKDWPGADNVFLFAEHIGEGSENPGVILYEAEPGGEKNAISLATGDDFEINSRFDCSAYERDGKLYVSRKTEAGWKESYLADASQQEFEGRVTSGMAMRFDESGSNLYYLDEIKPGPLYRYSVADGSITAALDKTDWFFMLGDVPFTHTTEDKLYRGTQSPEMILEGVREIMSANGGAYLLTADGKVCFIADGEDSAKTLDSFSKKMDIDGPLVYCPPLEEDAGAALTVLSGEVDYCLYKLGVFRDNKYKDPLGAEEAWTICANLLSREDITGDRRAVLEDIKAGLGAYVLWTNGKAQRGAAASALENAAKSYSDYAAGASAQE